VTDATIEIGHAGVAAGAAELRRPAGRFLIVALATMAVGLLLTFALIAGTLAAGRERLPFMTLIDHQFAKLDGDLGDTVFVGDSSLGNAIDAAHFGALSGGTATSLALTGAFGYAGSYAMLLRTIERRPPANVVILHTADMLLRGADSDDLSALERPAGAVGKAQRLWLDLMNLDQLERSLEFMRDRLRGKAAAAVTAIDGDYVRQGPPKPANPKAAGFRAERINPGKRRYLDRIAALCREHRLNCIYAHGPLLKPVCEKSDAYFVAADAIIRSTGLMLATEKSPCIDDADLGDATDHVAPHARKRFTELYFEALKPYLAQPKG
jgi:hypothetical protein